jgi:hypothetical protein
MRIFWPVDGRRSLLELLVASSGPANGTTPQVGLRDDSRGIVGRISDRLKSRFGQESVFFDVEDIAAGHKWDKELSDRVGVCAALVTVIGRNWNPIDTQNNRPRLDNPRNRLHRPERFSNFQSGTIHLDTYRAITIGSTGHAEGINWRSARGVHAPDRARQTPFGRG